MPQVLLGDQAGIFAALERFKAHEPVVMPTETVYGLAAPTHDERALAQVYALKGRPATNPLIAHVTNSTMAQSIVANWDHQAQALADALWPGPMTIILPKHPNVPDMATAGLQTIAVRAPSHPIAHTLINTFGGPLSAPSANRSGNVSPTCVQHVLDDYEAHPEANDLLVLDGGPCDIGMESTVLSLVESQPKLLRPGTVSRATIESIIGPVHEVTETTQGASPGSSPKHYAPQTTIRLIEEASWKSASMKLNHTEVVFITIGPIPLSPHTQAIQLPSDPTSVAASLYATLRSADALAHKHCATSIIIIAPPNEAPWRAVRDRLQRAAAG